MGPAVQISDGVGQLRLAAVSRSEVLRPTLGRETFALAAAPIAPSATPSTAPSRPLGVAARLASHFGAGHAIAGIVRFVRAVVVILTRRRCEVCGRLLRAVAILRGAVAALARPAAAPPAPPLALLTLFLAIGTGLVGLRCRHVLGFDLALGLRFRRL